MSTWPIRSDGSATFNDAVTAGASGIAASATSMSYATMIANLAGQLVDGDTILFGSGGGTITATASILYGNDDISILGQLDAIPTIDMLGLYRIKPLDANNSNHNNLIIKDPNNSGIEWQSTGTGTDFTGKVSNVYVSGSSNQAFSVEPATNDTFHIEADSVVGANNTDDGWSMHTGATANVRNSVFSGNSQGFAGINGTTTKFYNCMFLDNNTGGTSADAFLGLDADSTTCTAEFYDCIFDGNIVTSPANITRVPTFKFSRCKFYGNYVSKSTSVDDAIIHLGTTGTRKVIADFDDCDFYRSITGKGMLLLRGTTSEYTINNCRITDTIKNSTRSIFTESGSDSSITNNEFRHLGLAFDNNNGAVISNNNFIDVDAIGGAGAAITGSTAHFPDSLFLQISPTPCVTARTRNQIIYDIVVALGGVVTRPVTRNSLLENWLDAVS